MEVNGFQINKSIKNKIIAPIPNELIKQRDGGGKKVLSYLSASTIIDMLNDTFGYMWSWKVNKEWIEQSEPYYNKYVNGKRENNPEKWIKEEQGPVAHVHCTLSVYVKPEDSDNYILIEKDGFGSKSILGKQNDQESIFKSAGTDALKKAASLLGIGLALYRDEEEQYYFDTLNYEDPWTEEEKTNHGEELAFITDYIKKYEVTDEDFDNYIYSLTEGASYSVTPDNITLIVDSIREQIASTVEE